MNIREFLLARIADDEGTAEWVAMVFPDGDVAPLHRRVLAECAAKRAIIEAHDPRGLRWEGFPRADKQVAYCVEDQLAAPCRTIRALAAVYADHPDYQKEWAV